MTFPLSHPACCVIDTQVVLDWVLFDDPRVQSWVRAIQNQTVRWIYSVAMRDEALRVVHYPAIAKRHDPAVSAQSVTARFARWGQLCATPPAQRQLVCRDPFDQMFFDLALAQRATHLLSRDRAVLQVARRARTLGLHIAPPEGAPAPI